MLARSNHTVAGKGTGEGVGGVGGFGSIITGVPPGPPPLNEPDGLSPGLLEDAIESLLLALPVCPAADLLVAYDAVRPNRSAKGKSPNSGTSEIDAV